MTSVTIILYLLFAIESDATDTITIPAYPLRQGQVMKWLLYYFWERSKIVSLWIQKEVKNTFFCPSICSLTCCTFYTRQEYARQTQMKTKSSLHGWPSLPTATLELPMILYLITTKLLKYQYLWHHSNLQPDSQNLIPQTDIDKWYQDFLQGVWTTKQEEWPTMDLSTWFS